jgi:hypothetical protein
MPSVLVEALTHRGAWMALGIGLAALAAARRSRARRLRYERLAMDDQSQDMKMLWSELEALRADEHLFERFEHVVRARLGVEVRRLLPGDRAGHVLETGRALRALIDDLEGEFDCALPPCATTEKLTLEQLVRIVARNAAGQRS